MEIDGTTTQHSANTIMVRAHKARTIKVLASGKLYLEGARVQHFARKLRIIVIAERRAFLGYLIRNDDGLAARALDHRSGLRRKFWTDHRFDTGTATGNGSARFSHRGFAAGQKAGPRLCAQRPVLRINHALRGG